MTSDLTAMTVDQIMRDRGVGKRYAYTLLRREQAKRMEGHVPQNQRDLILTILAGDTSIRNSNELSEAIHAAGSKLPPHDVTKTLWSLQKSRCVRFRERANGMLYAIELTPEGNLAAAKAQARSFKEVVLSEDHIVGEPPVPTAEIEGYAALPLAAEPYEEEYIRSSPEDIIEEALREAPPAVPWAYGMGGWVAMREVKERHQKAVKIRAALALLEEVGEDDVVLGLLDKITFTPLEEEVVQLLRFLKEIE